MPRPVTGSALPLLRTPPHFGAQAAVSVAGTVDGSPDATRADRLIAAMRHERVGGTFWAPPFVGRLPTVIVRASSLADARSIIDTLSEDERVGALWLGRFSSRHGLPGEALDSDVDPWSLLGGSTSLIAHGDDEWVALASVAGCPVRILSSGRFGQQGASSTQIRQAIGGHLVGVAYRDPFTGVASDAETTIVRLADWRRMLDGNRGIVAACGIAWWKRPEIRRFLETPAHPLKFFLSERRAVRHAARHGGAVAIWPSRVSSALDRKAASAGVLLVRVEDGFVRSVGLGSNLVPPSSITVDRQGIHYDPGRPSDLETMLAEEIFPVGLLDRAERLRETMLRAGISKYGVGGSSPFSERQPGKRLVLVPGQVEDDMSVRLGGAGLASNLELIRRTRTLEPDAEIWFRPHPDVDAGHRRGMVSDADALCFADRVVRGGSMAALLDRVDAVHVLTSLTGFEALLRNHDVTCHGVPFYAGWGLTRDLAQIPPRRGRQRTLAELVAAVLIVYPRYLDPVTGLPCPPEVLFSRMTDGTDHNRLGWVTRLRKLQGKLTRQRS